MQNSNIKEIRRELLKALKPPKVKSKKLFRRKTVLPLNDNIIQGVNQIIKEHFEQDGSPKFKTTNIISTTISSTKSLKKHSSKMGLFINKPKHIKEPKTERPNSSLHILDLLSNEKNRLLKPTRTLHDKITNYLNQIRQKESESLPQDSQKKHHLGKISVMSHHPLDTSNKYSNIDKLILKCEFTKQRYSDETPAILNKVDSSVKKVRKYCRIVNGVIKRNSNMNTLDLEFKTQEEKTHHIASSIHSQLKELYKIPMKP